ncbi:acyl-CoA synthetase [Labrys miyagiensis]|uniref:Acyl-CoA synthetase n=1 Tax=Labrys miyagiensis TaxID=346912 RepID=A0ABQ6CT98_9HYPH|nr:acyl-CoA synthetase [Labrys miyagiensis]GLS23551.1 acyl-CoA synthetase [Labrys miyagiensis]
MPTDYETGLGRNAANYTPMTPVDFIARAAEVHGDRLAVVHGPIRRNWAQTYERARRLASALERRGIGQSDTVAVLLPNIPAMVEAHFGIPMLGAVMNALNTRLDAASLSFMIQHGEAKMLIADSEYATTVREIVRQAPHLQLVIVDDLLGPGPADIPGATDYEALLAEGDPAYAWRFPEDEWNAITLNYTSGTTGNPKGVVYHHRGAATNAVSNILEWDMPRHAVYLWTLPMFHCNGWCFPWTVALRAGVNVCLRKVEAQACFDLIRQERVTHYCGAPIVHSLLANAPDALRAGIDWTVKGMVAGAPPPSSLLARTSAIGFELTHVYGLTEVYGPATVCAEQAEWAALGAREQAVQKARQGVRYHLEAGASVFDPETMQPVPADGETIGEIMFRGNICMKGYLKNEEATQKAFAGGWFHTGDLAVLCPDGYIKIKDRAKDIIISGGENISSVEVEDVLYQHPAVLAVAVVAQPHEKWGETPCAFVELKEGAVLTADELIAFACERLARFKVPRTVLFETLPKTSTGKIQKFELRQRIGSTTAIDV